MSRILIKGGTVVIELIDTKTAEKAASHDRHHDATTTRR